MSVGFPGARTALEVAARRATEQKNADAIARKAQRVGRLQAAVGENQSVLTEAGIVRNDNVAPFAPVISATPYQHAIDVTWPEPPVEDYVVSSLVTITPQGEAARTVVGGQYGVTITNLSAKAHTVSVRLVDRWGLRSAASNTVAATPLLTAAESVHLAELALQGRLQGLLPDVNLAPIGDPSKFAAGVVQNTALAAGQNANVLPWNEATFENYLPPTWPPVGVVSVGALAPSLVTVRNWKWLRLVSDAAFENYAPFADWNTRGIITGPYIWSCVARYAGGGATTARLIVQHASDTAGTGVATAVNGPVIALPASGEETRLFAKFTYDPTKPYYRVFVRIEESGRTVDVTRFMLEAVTPAQTQPGKWSAPVTSFGVMSGRLLAVMDLATVNAVIGSAAIGSAKIQDLVVDKLLAGTFTAGNMTLAGAGALKAGKTTLDASGLTLQPTDALNQTSEQADYKISSPGGHAIHFFNDATLGLKGIALQTDESTSARRAQVVLIAGNTPASSTRILVKAPEAGDPTPIVLNAGTYLGGRLELIGDLYMHSPDGSLWRIRVSDSGALTTARA